MLHYDSDSGAPYANSIDVGDVSTTTVEDLAPETTYYFALHAYNDYGESGLSAEASATTTSLIPSPLARSVP